MMKLLIVDAVAHSRDSLATYLALQDGLEVVGQAERVVDAIWLSEQLHPDVVIMDSALRDADGFTATRQLLGLDIPPVVILLTVHRQLQDMRRAEEAGAVACIEKSGGVDLVLSTLHALSERKSEADASPSEEN